MNLNNEWHDSLIEHYNTNVRIRLDSTVCDDVKCIAKEEELHSKLLLECYNLIAWQFNTSLDQDRIVRDVFNASRAIIAYDKKYRR